MTPQERQLVADLFDRLATVENAPRDADAERTIAEGLRRAPGAIYALVQTVLVQDEALKRADQRIRDLEAADAPREAGGFLDTMRDALMGRQDSRDTPRGSVPSVRPGTQDSRWNDARGDSRWSAPQGQPPAAAVAPAPGERGGSFLGTAAAAAAGMVGGSLLASSIGSMFGHRGQAFGDTSQGSGQLPWGGSSSSGGELSREAGLNDIGQSGDQQRSGFFDTASADDNDDFGSDFGGDDFGGGDDSI